MRTQHGNDGGAAGAELEILYCETGEIRAKLARNKRNTHRGRKSFRNSFIVKIDY